MSGQVSQIKVTIPAELHNFLRLKAQRYGLNIATYVKNLIIDDVKDKDIPVYRASEQVEKSYQLALKDKDQAVEVADIADFFDNL